MKKHKFNIFPEMSPEDYQKLLGDLQTHGYDHTQPIYIYENAVLDGWNRYRACLKLNLAPSTEDFKGTPIEAINFVMRTNKRRNLTSSQWATIAVDAEEIVRVLMEATEKARREKQAETQKVTKASDSKGLSDNKLSDSLKPEIVPSDNLLSEGAKQAETLSQTLAKNKVRVTDNLLSVTLTENKRLADNKLSASLKPEILASDNLLSEAKTEAKKLSDNLLSDSLQVEPKPEESADLAALQADAAKHLPDIEAMNAEQSAVVAALDELRVEYDEAYKPKEHINKTATKLATQFNTNRTYINEAEKLKRTAPEKFKEVQQGTKSIPQARKEVEAEKEPPPPETKPDSLTDAFTETAAKHGRAIHALLTELQQSIVKANNDFARHKQDFDHYGNIRKTDLSQMVLDARMLKSLSKCANCKGGKCQWCKHTGYQNKSNYSTTKSAIGK